MPKSISYRPVLIDELITNERLNSYAPIFQHSDDMELVGAYIWNIHVCSALYPLLTTAEVSLRNSIDTALNRDLGYFWWSSKRLHYNSFRPGKPEPYPVTAVTDNFNKATKQVITDKKRRYNIKKTRPSHHEVIAKTEFSTWENLLDSEFMGPKLIWPKHLGVVFRGSWPTSKASSTLRSAKDLVKAVREFRNRVSHHEPVWKRYGVHSEKDAISHLHEKLAKIQELVSLVSPEKYQLIKKHGLLSAAERVCTIEELRYYQRNFETNKVKSIAKLGKLAEQSVTNNRKEHITIYRRGKIQFLIQPL
jgi:hypothetical protein